MIFVPLARTNNMSQEKLLPPHQTVLETFNDWFTPGETIQEACYLCNGDIQPGSHISMYHSDANLAESPDASLDGWWAHRVYCEDCKQTSIVCPHEGTTEALYDTYAPTDKPIDGYGICDHSLGPDGRPWQPAAILEAVSGIPLDDFVSSYRENGESVSHAAVVDALRIEDIDIRTLIDDKGTVQLTSKEKSNLQDHFNRAALAKYVKS